MAVSKLRVDFLTNKNDNGAVEVTQGLKVSANKNITFSGGTTTLTQSSITSNTITASGFSGPLTGNVTGNASTATTAITASGLTGSPSITVTTVSGTTANFSGNIIAAGNHYVKLARFTDQTILNNSDTLIAFTAVSDTNSWFNASNNRITPTVAGNYYVSGMVNWQAGSVTNNQTNIQIRKNANTFAISQVGIQTFSYTMNVYGIVTMNGTTDYIELTVFTGNPTSQSVRGTPDGAWTKLEFYKIN